MPPRDLRQQRQVLHLEGQRARGLHEQKPRRGAKLPLDIRPDARRIKARLDAVARQCVAAEPARGRVDRIGHQHVVALPHVRQDRDRAGRQPRWQGPAAVSGLERRQRIAKSVMARRAVQTVSDRHRVVAARAAPDPLAHVVQARMQHGRAAHQRRIDEPGAVRAVAAQRGQERLRLQA